MKKLILCFVITFCCFICFISGCKKLSPADSNISENTMVENIHYIKKGNLCFAYFAYKAYGYDAISLTYVPCDKIAEVE